MTRLALAIDAAHPAFEGHFPSRPIVPGVVLLDVSLRAIATNFGIGQDQFAAMICKIGSAKFLSPVGPGEPLRLEVESTRKGSAESGVPFASYAMRVFAGNGANQRIAVTGTVSFEPRVVDVRVVHV